MATMFALALGTFLSEDLTCIAAGLLIQRGELTVTAGMVGCTVGIFAGDFGLWVIGRLFGATALAWPWTARRLTHRRAEDLRAWLERHAAGAIVASRFMPGTRLPLYLIAGVLRMPGGVFAVWAFVASLLWTPTLILLTAALGDAFVTRVRPLVGVGWTAGLVVAGSVLLTLHLARLVPSIVRTRTSAPAATVAAKPCASMTAATQPPTPGVPRHDASETLPRRSVPGTD